MLAAQSSPSAPRPGRAPLAGHAYEHLKARILEGDLEPGDRLSVPALAQALACSRVPVMEALKRLQTDGLVDIVPQVGCQVAVPKADDVADFFAAFAAVEGAVASLAAQRRTDADLTAFRQTLATIEQALQGAGGPQDRDPRYRRLNRQPSAPAGTRLDDALGGDAWLITLDSLSREPLRPFAAALRDWLESRGVEAVLVRPDRYVFAAGEANTVLTAWDRQAAGPRPRRP